MAHSQAPAFFADMVTSLNVRFITELQPGMVYDVLRVYRLRHPTQRHYVVHVLEPGEIDIGKYILPLDDYFCANEITMINDGQMICAISFRGIDQSGNPIIEIEKIINPRPSVWERCC